MSKEFMNKIKVAIIVGSDSDLPILEGTAKILEEFGISFKINIASAHRSPEKVKDCVRTAEKSGAEVFVCAAGMSAALPGVVASMTSLPVIGIPIEAKAFGGIDALLSIVQMPPGIPVATVAVGNPGAVNAGLLAVEILAVRDKDLRKDILDYRKKLASNVSEKNETLQKIGLKKYVEKSCCKELRTKN